MKGYGGKSEAGEPDHGATGRAGVTLDPINCSLIEQLQLDGRRSYAALAKTVELSEAAVRQRVQRLLDAGVMQVVAATDPLTLGFARQAMIGIRADGDLREIAAELAEVPEIDYVVACAGSFDLLVELVCKDDDHLLAILNDKIRATPGVRTTETFIYLKLVKQSYTWGTPFTSARHNGDHAAAAPGGPGTPAGRSSQRSPRSRQQRATSTTRTEQERS